jgi:L-fuculokinase
MLGARRATAPVTEPLLGILDVGKTHARFLTAHPSGNLQSEQRRENAHGVRSQAVRQLDIGGIEEWLCQVISAHPQRERIRTLVPIAHGAAGVLIGGSGQTICAPDYEDPVFEQVAAPYRLVRDRFESTYSPYLPLGLNLGRQLFFLSEHCPELFRRARTLLLYPQYWAWRMCGVAASEVTSLGCHSDLWRPTQRRVTDLAKRAGWDALLPRLRHAHDCLGTVSTDFARRTGLPAECRVLCGLHDSNASLLAHSTPHGAESLAVVSSGTWTIIMARGPDPKRVREPLDMLTNVDINGVAIPTARFMGGREYETIAGKAGLRAAPTLQKLESIIERGIVALPAFSRAGGPFANTRGALIGAANLSGADLAALASTYVALMTDYALDLLGMTGRVIVDGPLGRNAPYLQMLAQLRPADRICRAAARCSAAVAAAKLLSPGHAQLDDAEPLQPAGITNLDAYRRRWRAQLPPGAAA